MPDGTQQQRRLRVSPSIVISILALVIATSSGAYAAVTIAAKNSVVSKSIKNHNVKTADIKNGAVKKNTLAGDSVDSSKLVDGSVTSGDIGDGQVGTTDIGDGQVGLNDLSAAAKTDLNDATTVGGLTVAQLIAASGGEYYEGNQGASGIDIEKLPVNEATVATLLLPHAGKYLVSTHVPVTCVYDNSGTADPDPAIAGSDNPWFYGQSRLKIGSTVLQSETGSCAADAGQAVVIVGIWVGTVDITINRLVTVTGPTTLTLTGSSAPSNAFGVDVIASRAVTVSADNSKIQAVTVQ